MTPGGYGIKHRNLILFYVIQTANFLTFYILTSKIN
jgi:hypothetical protein